MRRLLLDFSEMQPGSSSSSGTRNAKFTTAFDTVFAGAGIEVRKSPPRAPRANAYPERWVLTVRSECPDWTLIPGPRHLQRVLCIDTGDNDTAGLHRSLHLALPVGHEESPYAGAGRIVRRDLVGGLIPEYHSAA